MDDLGAVSLTRSLEVIGTVEFLMGKIVKSWGMMTIMIVNETDEVAARLA